MEKPKLRAFCLRAPGVRFMALEILATGVFAFECLRSSFLSAAVHARRLVALDIYVLPVRRGAS
jgi:hypothetical protein